MLDRIRLPKCFSWVSAQHTLDWLTYSATMVSSSQLERDPFANVLSERCTGDNSVVECLIGFVADTSIQSIKRATDDNVADWYYSVSYMAPNYYLQTLTEIISTLKSLFKAVTSVGIPPVYANTERSGGNSYALSKPRSTTCWYSTKTKSASI